jgi:hypothetical protein
MRWRREPRTTHPDDLQELRRFHAEDAAQPADARAAARVALLQAIEAEARAAGPRPAAPRAPRARRRLFAGGLGLAACAATALAFLLGSGGVRPEHADASAASAALNAAAIVTANATADVKLGAGRYWYVRSEEVQHTHLLTVDGVAIRVVDVRTRTETWVDAEGGGRRVTNVVRDVRFATPADRRAWIDSGRVSLGLHQSLRFAPGADGWQDLVGMSHEQLRALPGDDDHALVARLAAATAGQPGGSFLLAAQLLRQAPLAPAQRAALYRVMAKTPGTTLQGTLHDLDGRLGTAVSLVRNGVRVTLIFDPDTAALLDVDYEVTDVDAALAANPGFDRTTADALAWHETLLASGVVRSTHSRP